MLEILKVDRHTHMHTNAKKDPINCAQNQVPFDKVFGFDDNRNLCSHAGMHVYVCPDAQLVNMLSQEGKRGHIWYVGVSHWVKEPYCFW